MPEAAKCLLHRTAARDLLHRPPATQPHPYSRFPIVMYGLSCTETAELPARCTGSTNPGSFPDGAGGPGPRPGPELLPPWLPVAPAAPLCRDCRRCESIGEASEAAAEDASALNPAQPPLRLNRSAAAAAAAVASGRGNIDASVRTSSGLGWPMSTMLRPKGAASAAAAVAGEWQAGSAAAAPAIPRTRWCVASGRGCGRP